MEVIINSMETIKPSSPTPPHLKAYKVSLMDKMSKTMLIPIITYYSIKHPNEVDVERIKFALAQTLTRFYPIAGRPADDGSSTIDCSDEGVSFATARVNCRLADLLKNPKIMEFYKFLPPFTSVWSEGENNHVAHALMGIQFNVFECGGIALSVLTSHYICDAVSIVAFLKCWSEISRVDSYVAYPSFQGVEVFPTDDHDAVKPSSFWLDKSSVREGKCSMQRFVFNKDSIQALREKARSKGEPNPSRVQAVSMFVWKQCMDSSTRVWGVRQPSIMTVPADLRRRMAPLLSKYSFGNIVTIAMIQSCNSSKDDITGLVKSFRASMKEDVERIIPTLMKNRGGGRETLLQCIEKLGKKRKDKNLNSYSLTSWFKLGFTDIDFGWGKPVWFSQSGMDDIPSQYKNGMMIVDGESGDKIELWIILDSREMNGLENNQDFLNYASPNPPVFI